MMNNNLTNLLPPERLRLIRRGYYVRLGVTLAGMLTVLVGIAAVLLLPSYVFLVQSEKVKEGHLANLETTSPSVDENKLSARLTALSVETATLTNIGKAPSASSIIRSMLFVPRPGIVLSGFSYTASGGGVPGTLLISGVAATRDSLRVYKLALQNVDRVISVDLPVSAYAKDSQISFSITLTLSP